MAEPARRYVQPADVTDLSEGFLLREMTPGVFFISNGNYQTLFFTTGEGVVLVDAPTPLIEFIPRAIADVTDEQLRTVIYSHGHNDHIGGTYLLPLEDVEIIGEAGTARFLEEKHDPKRPLPTTVYEWRRSLTIGSRRVELIREGFHSADGDTVIYLPDEGVLVAIDLLSHDWVPVLDFDITENMFAYTRAFDKFLKYEFTYFLSGHTADAATRRDVVLTRDYVNDVYETVSRIHTELDTAELLAEDRDDEQEGIRRLVEQVTERAYEDVASRWLDGPLRGVALWTESHCRQMVIYVRWTD